MDNPDEEDDEGNSGYMCHWTDDDNNDEVIESNTGMM